MHGRKLAQMESLRARIAALEAHPVLAGGAMPPGPDGADGVLATAPGRLHEVFAAERRNGGAALGFALALARDLLTAQRPVLLAMQLSRDVQDMGLPYGPGLRSFGLDPQAVVLARTDNIVELLWAVEEAVCCRAVAAVVADIAGHHKALDFTASRRLSLRAAGAGTSVVLVRYGRGREASAATYRWGVSPARSGDVAFDPRAPGGPRWRVVLEKGRLGGGNPGRDRNEGWLLDWTENGFGIVDGGKRKRLPAAGGPPLPGAQPAVLGDRLSQAG
jgi:protein ImuA